MTTYVTPFLQNISCRNRFWFYLWMRTTVTIVYLIRKTPHANTHHRLTAKLCLTEPSVSCAVKLSDSEEQHNIHTHTTNTHRKAWKLRWTFKTPATQSLSSRARVKTHSNLETRVWDRRDHNYHSWPHLTSHIHTHTHSNLPSANNRAVCGGKK